MKDKFNKLIKAYSELLWIIAKALLIGVVTTIPTVGIIYLFTLLFNSVYIAIGVLTLALFGVVGYLFYKDTL